MQVSKKKECSLLKPYKNPRTRAPASKLDSKGGKGGEGEGEEGGRRGRGEEERKRGGERRKEERKRGGRKKRRGGRRGEGGGGKGEFYSISSSNAGLFSYTYCKRQPPWSKWFRKIGSCSRKRPLQCCEEAAKPVYKEVLFCCSPPCVFVDLRSFLSTLKGGCYEEHP